MSMEPRSLQYIAQATGGRLRRGSPNAMASRICIDSRQVQPGDLFFALAGERFDAHQFLPDVGRRGVAAVVAQASKTPEDFDACPVIVVDSPRAALGRLGGCYRKDFDLPIVAVAGSNGKTTTKELIASVLRQKRAVLWSEASFNNDIGVPLTLLRLERPYQAAVLETGTNHPGELEPLLAMIAPKLGVVTNIGREHLEFFGDLAGVAQEEGAMAEALPPEGVLILHGDSPWCDAIARRTRARVVKVGLEPGNDWQALDLRIHAGGCHFSVRAPRSELSGDYTIKLLGRHQVVNALFALAIGAELGLERAALASGLAACLPARMRLQLSQPGGVTVLDDTYNANADSVLAALRTLADLPCAGRRIAVLGEMAELGQTGPAAHAEVGRNAANFHLDALVAVGPQASEMAQAARAAGMAKVMEFAVVADAIPAVTDLARPGDVLLIKASRAMRLERITEALRVKLAGAGALS